jgi:xanthine dehydrogenase/oxidase
MRMSVRGGQAEDAYRVEECGFGWGGMAPRTVPSLKAERYLCGRQLPLSSAEQSEVERLLGEEDLRMPEDAPGGMVPYRRKLAVNFLRRFLWSVQHELSVRSGGAVPDVDPRVLSALEVFERPVSRGTQRFQVGDAGEGELHPGGGASSLVSDPKRTGASCSSKGNGAQVTTSWAGVPAAHYPHRHMSADQQADGTAVYTTDIPYPPNTAHGALVTSTRPHARLLSVDATEALSMEGVRGFFSAKDIPGENQIGPVFRDEELFASDTVLAHGFPIGVVVADTPLQARLASAKVLIYSGVWVCMWM